MKKANPIPSHAKKVFEGVRWQVYQWEQEMFDGTTEIYESLKRPDGASVIGVLDDGQVVIIEEYQPHWHEKSFSIPAGNLEENEDPLLGAKRELEEETGIVFKDFYLVGISNPHPGIDHTHYTFIAKNFVKQKEKKLDPGEKITSLFVSKEKLIEMIREKAFLNRPHLITDFIVADRIPEFFDMLEHPEKYAL